jgi:murein DD-endopeptidase MepM/ murein hydrolase activator NlpD
VSAVGDIWKGIQDKFAGPWNWVKEHVFEPIAKAYNAVAKVVGAPTVNLADGGPVGQNAEAAGGGRATAVAAADGGPIPEHAAGGRIRGRGHPRQDNIAGIDRSTGVQTSWVSAGEYVVNAKQYQKNKNVVEAINSGLDFNEKVGRRLNREAVARAFGGEIPQLWLGGGTKPAAGAVAKHSGYGWARWAGDINEPGAADIGHPVKAYKSGTVASTTSLTTSYGKHIRVNHGGNERTLYAHLSQFSVNPGQSVSEGQKIGEKGNTGNSTGPHLHFELAGGSDKITDKVTGAVGAAVGKVLEMIKPRSMFMTATGPIMSAIEKGLAALPGGKTPFGELLGRFPRKLRDMLAGKLPESFGIESDEPGGGGGGGSTPNGVNGLGPAAKKARAYVIDRWGITNIGGYANRNIAGTNQLSKHALGKAIDIMNSNVSRGNEIAGYFAGAGRGTFNVDNVIWNRRITNAGRGWNWGSYSGVSPHTDHVHVDFHKDGGLVRAPGLAAGGIVQGGRGGTLAHIGEGARDELVTPLPRGWKAADSGGDMRRLIALLEERGLGETHLTMNAYNPVAEPTTVSTNKALQRVGALGLV